MTTEKYFMTAKEINTSYLGISEAKLYELLNKKGCPKVMIGKKYLVPVKAFLDWLQEKHDDTR